MGKKIQKQRNKGSKRIKSPITPESSNQKKPVFCLQYLDREYCVTKCEKEDKVAIIGSFYNLSRLTWQQISQSGRHQNGFEKIDRKSIKRPIPSHITPDTTIIAFRYNGKKAMVGYRLDVTFHIVWFDRDFTLYNH